MRASRLAGLPPVGIWLVCVFCVGGSLSKSNQRQFVGWGSLQSPQPHLVCVAFLRKQQENWDFFVFVFLFLTKATGCVA